MLQHTFVGLEEAPEHRPAAALPVVFIVIEVQYLPSSNRSWPIGSDHTVSPEFLSRRKQDTCYAFFLEVFCDGHTDPDVWHKGLCVCEEDRMDLASVAGVRYVVFLAVSCPGTVCQELAVKLAEFHGSDSATARVVDLLADLAIVPSVDDAASIGEEVEDVCYREYVVSNDQTNMSIGDAFRL